MAGSTVIDTRLRDVSLRYRVARRHSDEVLIDYYATKLDELLDAKNAERVAAHA